MKEIESPDRYMEAALYEEEEKDFMENYLHSKRADLKPQGKETQLERVGEVLTKTFKFGGN